MIYLIGSLRNPGIPKIANRIRETGAEVFDDWHAAGPEADDYWRDYERGRGRSLPSALQGLAARNVYEFDRRNLERAETVVLVLPAGKSGHMELGWALGRGKKGYILLDNDPDRYDVMYNFATGVFDNVEDLVDIFVLENPLPYLTRKWNEATIGKALPKKMWSGKALYDAFIEHSMSLNRFIETDLERNHGMQVLRYRNLTYQWSPDLRPTEVRFE